MKAMLWKMYQQSKIKNHDYLYDELMDYGPAVIDSLEKINDFIKK